jgi:L-phenylalanine/L-methionine N-acetyltransferase
VSDIQIRAQEPSDAQALHAIFGQPTVYTNTLQLPWQSYDAFRERLSRPETGVHRLVAVVDGRVVGGLVLELAQNPRRADCASMGMSVNTEFHNRGVGAALMAAMVELADNWLGVRRIELTVWTDNAAAIHLYEKFGFVVEGTARQYARRAGQLVDAHFMARLRQA